MGDVVIFGPEGQELRLTHEDFTRRGVIYDPLIGNQIVLSREFIGKLGGPARLSVFHTSNIDGEEARFHAHNAYVGDGQAFRQVVAYTQEQKNGESWMILPNDFELKVIHEYGEGTIDTDVTVTPEQLTGRSGSLNKEM